jgi:hypothetical protein
MRWPQLWPFEPPIIHLDKRYDLGTPPKYKRFNICLGQV